MNFPALKIRDAHERLEAMGEASVIMVGLNPERILQGLVQLQYQKTGMQPQQINEPYGAENKLSQISADKKRKSAQISEKQIRENPRETNHPRKSARNKPSA